MVPEPEVVARVAAVAGAGGGESDDGGAREWAAVVRSLERGDPSFRS